MSQLLCVGAPGMRLCILGAGNCNDLDFEALSAWYSEITLVDLDLEAVTRAIERQPVAVRSLLRVRAPVDFGGFDEAISRGGTGAAAPPALAAAVARDVGVRDFDVVCSACVLSQLIDHVAQRFGSEPERCLSQVQLTRALHNARFRAAVCSRSGSPSPNCSPGATNPAQRSLRCAEMGSGAGWRADRPPLFHLRADVLYAKIRKLCDAAIEVAAADGRKTVMDRDFR